MNCNFDNYGILTIVQMLYLVHSRLEHCNLHCGFIEICIGVETSSIVCVEYRVRLYILV